MSILGGDSVIDILYNSLISAKEAMRFKDISIRVYLIPLATILINSLTVRHFEETGMGMCVQNMINRPLYRSLKLICYAIMSKLDCS